MRESVGELHLEGTAEEVGEGGEDVIQAPNLKPGDAEHTLLERGETESGTEGTAREDEEGEGLVLGEVEAEHLLLLAGGSLLDAARVAAVERGGRGDGQKYDVAGGGYFAAWQTLRLFDDPEKHRGRRRRTRVTRHASPPGQPCKRDHRTSSIRFISIFRVLTKQEPCGRRRPACCGTQHESDIMLRAPMETAGFAAGRDGRAGGDARAASDHGGTGHDGGGNGDSSHLDCTVCVFFGA